MSIDASVSLFFPMSRASAALESLRKVLRRRKFVLGLLVATPDGETIRIPATAWLNNEVEVTTGGVSRLVKVPTISPAFPEVFGTEPIFPLDEETSVSGIDVEVAFREDGKVVDSMSVGLSIARGREYLEIALDAGNSRDAGDFVAPRFRSRVAKVLVDGAGVVAVYRIMGELSSFADHTPIKDPDGQAEAAGIDAFVAFLIGELSA